MYFEEYRISPVKPVSSSQEERMFLRPIWLRFSNSARYWLKTSPPMALRRVKARLRPLYLKVLVQPSVMSG